jgi:hypothetical protein
MNSWLDVPLNVLTVAPTVDEDELLLDDMMSIVNSKVSLW